MRTGDARAGRGRMGVLRSEARGRRVRSRAMIDEVAPGLLHWLIERHGLPPTMNAYALRDGEDTILVDPVVGRRSGSPNEELIEALGAIVQGRLRIFVTTPFHVRGSDVLRRRWGDEHELTIYGTRTAPARIV